MASQSSQNSLQTIDQELVKVLGTKVISGLDALRALAVGLVLIDHFRLFEFFFQIHPKTGSLGVMIFFVLSGFLITSMLLKEYRKTGLISLSNFYRRRSYRIFPSFYCCWILTTVVYCLAHQFQWKPAALSFFYLMDYGRAFAPENVRPWMQMLISWSLAVEEKFYLLWPLLLLFLLKRPPLARLVAYIIFGQWIYRAVLYLLFHVSIDYVYSTFDMRVDALLVGCLLAILVENETTRVVCCAVLRKQSFSLLAPAALVLVVIAPLNNQSAWLVVWSLQPVIIAVMMLQVIYWGARSWTVCSHGMVRLTAQLSYALYLYHPLAGVIVKLLNLRHLGYPAVLLTLVMAPASYFLVERPFMRLRDRQQPPARGRVIPASNLVAE
jgi:peptidoglycan/LPS O-acetylase OafA/YrhL